METHTRQAHTTQRDTAGVRGMPTGDDAFAARTLTWATWLTAILALLTFAFGVLILVEPSITLSTLAVLVGIYLLASGVIELAWAILGNRENRGLAAVFGVLSSILGVLLIRHPTHAVTAVALLIGLWLLAAGLIRLVRTFGEAGNRIWSLLLAVAEIVFGAVIVSDPRIGVTTLAVVIGIALIVRAVALGLIFAALWAVKHASPESLDTAGA
jgi:uncharacterized membrane protein HdeD (DUF308 family)